MLIEKKKSHTWIYIVLLAIVFIGIILWSMEINPLDIINKEQINVTQCQIQGYQLRNLDQLNQIQNISFTYVYYFDIKTNITYALKLVPSGNLIQVG